MNQARMVEAWQARLYFFSSGTIFKNVNKPLLEWLLRDKDRRVEYLTKLNDPDEDSEMFHLLAECVFNFIKFKKAPFPNAMISQEDFWNVECWKRAIIFIFLYRITLDRHVNAKYFEWTVEDFDLTRSLFRRSVEYMHITCISHATDIHIACASHVTHMRQVDEKRR